MLALDPNETFEAWPKSEDGTGAVFVFRYLTAREWRKVNRLAGDYEALQKLTAEEVLDRLTEALRVNLVGWRVGAHGGDEVTWIPFEPARLEDLCTISELWDLFDAARRQSRLGGPEKKRIRVAVAFRNGKVCKACGDGCPDGPTDSEPAEFECAACGGCGCELCVGGVIRLTSCPHVYAGEETFEMLALADLFEKGLAPVPGGALDQAQVFLDAARFVWHEQAYWESV